MKFGNLCLPQGKLSLVRMLNVWVTNLWVIIKALLAGVQSLGYGPVSDHVVARPSKV